MKTVFTAISGVVLSGVLGLGTIGLGTAQALPRLDGVAAGATNAAPANIEKARVVCGRRGCFRTGYRVYRPYGYYRPYYYRPGIGVGIGPFGVGIY